MSTAGSLSLAFSSELPMAPMSSILAAKTDGVGHNRTDPSPAAAVISALPGTLSARTRRLGVCTAGMQRAWTTGCGLLRHHGTVRHPPTAVALLQGE